MFSRVISRIPRSNIIIRSFSSSSSDAPLHKTALFEDHVKLCGKMVPFAGYSLPVQYKDSIINSHNHCRNSASIFDVSHMGQLKIHGKKGIEFLESITVADIGALKINQARLSSLVTEEGGMIDDCMITKKDGYIYMVINAGCKEKDLKDMNEQLSIFNKKHSSDVSIELLGSHELLALQGPKAAEALTKVLGKDNPSFDINKFPFMFNTELKLAGISCGVSRSGYTGEDGFEISVPRQSVSKLFHIFLEYPSVLAAGLGVRDSLRLEAGLCLYGHEMNETISPIEAGLAWTITKRRREQGGFPGHPIMMKQLKEGVTRKRIGLTMLKGPPAREGSDIINNAGEKIGFVTSGTFSPSLNKGIAMGYVSTNEAKEGNQIKAVIRGKPYEAEIVKMPFVTTRYFKVL